MTHRILIELTADDPDSLSFGKLAAGLKTLEQRGVRVTGVEALAGEQALVLAHHLRLALKADGMASRLKLFRSK